MLHGALSLLERSLRIDARGWTTHLARLGLMLAIYFALCFSLTMQSRFGAPGLRFFQGIAYLDVAFMTLLGLGFFSTAITEEKEEDTLGLMLMAGISPLAILAGKSGGRLWQAVLLIGIQCPFMLLAVTMGGVTTGQIWSVTIALLAYMIFLAGFGLLCSTLAPRNRTAAALMTLGLVVYVLVPCVTETICWYHTRWIAAGYGTRVLSEFWFSVLKRIGDLCVVWRLGDIFATGFTQSPWSLQVVTNGSAGLVCAGLSWLLFGLATHNPSTESTSRGWVARRRAFFRFNAGRPWINPFVWKDFHFVSGGIGMMLARTVFYGVPTIALLAYHYVRDFPDQDEATETCLLLMTFVVTIDAAILLARSLHDEVRGQTLSTLSMLPRSSNRMVYAKFAGALLVWLPAPIIELTMTLGTIPGRRDFWMFVGNEHGIGWVAVLWFVLIPHYAALAALYVRWGAVPVAIGTAFGSYFVIGMVAMLFDGTQAITQIWIFFAVTILMICTCVACQIGILLRVHALSVR